jgi:hypothetical protein
VFRFVLIKQHFLVSQVIAEILSPDYSHYHDWGSTPIGIEEIIADWGAAEGLFA